MDYYITAKNLTDLGVELDDEALKKIVDELNEKVDEKIGLEIITSLTPEDVDTLASMQQDKVSEEDIAKWITEHVPDYPEIIEDNTAIVLGDFAEESDLVNDKDTNESKE